MDLSLTHDLPAYDKKVIEVVTCWFKLSKEHLEEARGAAGAKCVRSVYSRSYYAAYNASKAVRYLVKGEVSLGADDHAKASKLPDDFPEVAKWTQLITTLYEHRLRADYDNWKNTSKEHAFNPADCLAHAEQFIVACGQYAKNKFGVIL